MNAERWQQVEQLYHALRDCSADARAAALSELCSNDQELRREVESLLEYEDKARNFIETPALEVAAKTMASTQELTKLAGQRIAHYEIISLLGAGGMGEVYLGEDTKLGRKVALKFLPTLLTQDKTHLQRFEQESRALAALSHPNVCVIHEIVKAGEGRHCIVMEYVDGVTLRERIAKNCIDVREAVDVAIQIVSAISAAHAAGIIHRDIKPENVILRRDGYVKILDFGLAKLVQKKSESVGDEAETQSLAFKTSPGLVIGTVAYMSPQQARGLSVDARTDVWSVGVVLYEMLTGRQPFAGATAMDVIIEIAEREPEPITKYLPEAPAKLEVILCNALAKDEAARYQTAQYLLVDLKKLRHDIEISSESTRSGFTNTNKKTRPLKLTKRLSLILFTLAAVLIVAGFIFAKFFRDSPRQIQQNDIKSLAVLPLDNLSGDASQDYFADGMTESLITDLAKIGALRVISRPSVLRYKGIHKTPSEIGSELNVDAILIGSVVRSGEHVRIAIQLIQARTEKAIWTDSYERDLRDVLALQKEVTQDIVGQVKIKLTPQEQGEFGAVRPVNPESYDHYLRGRYYLNRQNKEDNEAAITSLETAVKTDPSFATAYAELAQAYAWRLFLFEPDEKEWAEKAFVAAEKAIALDPNLAVAHLARGRILWTPANHFPHDKAIKEYRLAVALNPSLDEARNQLALVYCHIGAFEQALEESRKAISTNPYNNLAQIRIGQTLNFQGKYEEALSVLRSIPQDVNPALVGHQIAWALFNLGRKEEASATLRQLLNDHPEDSGGLFKSLQAVLAASAGQERMAEEKIKLAIESGKGFGHFHHTAYHIACAYALMSKPADSIKWLQYAADDGFPCYPLFERDPNLNRLREDPRFVAFLAKQKEQWEVYRANL